MKSLDNSHQSETVYPDDLPRAGLYPVQPQPFCWTWFLPYQSYLWPLSSVGQLTLARGSVQCPHSLTLWRRGTPSTVLAADGPSEGGWPQLRLSLPVLLDPGSCFQWGICTENQTGRLLKAVTITIYAEVCEQSDLLNSLFKSTYFRPAIFHSFMPHPLNYYYTTTLCPTWMTCCLSLVTVTLMTHLLNCGSADRRTW